MSQTHEKSQLIHHGKSLSLASFSQLCGEALKDRLTSKSQQKYYTVLEIVEENELEYDSLNLFSRLISSLLRAGAKDLIDLILTKPPKYDASSAHHFIKSFEAYQNFCITLLSFDCSYIIKVTNYILNEALKLCTISVSGVVSLEIGEDNHFDSIEEIQKRAREILQGTKKNKLTELRNQRDTTFMSALLKKHPNAHEKGLDNEDMTMAIYKGKSKQNTPCFFVSLNNENETVKSTPSQNNDRSDLQDISYMKCINEVAVKLSHSMISSMEELRLDIRMFIDLAVKIADKFPFNKPKILNLIIKMIPHSALHVQVHAIFIRILFYIMNKMPYYEEEILEAVLTRFIQIDVSIKSKQLAYKRHFTSNDLKADVYLYYLIHHFKERLRTIEEDSIPSLQTPPKNSQDAHMDSNSEIDSIESSDDEEVCEDSATSKNKMEKFCDMLIKLFENNVLPYSESHYPQYCFLYVCSVNQVFLQKLITLFILRAFNSKESYGSSHQFRGDQIHSKVCNINYLCSLLATSGKEIMPINIFLDSIKFLVKFFKKKFHSKKVMDEQMERYSSASECGETPMKRNKKTIKIDDKLFYISVVQGLSYIMTYKFSEIENEDPTLVAKILKIILNNEFKAVLFNQGQLLRDLLEALKGNCVKSKYIRRLSKLIKEQKGFLRYKKDLFNRIKRKMPFGTPLFLIESSVYFENIHSHLPNNQIQESIAKNLIPPEHKYGLQKKKVKVEEEEEDKVEMPTSNYEDPSFNAALIAAFGPPKSAVQSKDIRQTIFGKLGRSLSMDFKHKLKATSSRSRQESKDNFQAPIPINLVKKLQFDTRINPPETHFDLTESALEQLETFSDGYASNKETDVASIDLLDRSKPWMHRRKNRSRNRNRKANRMKQSMSNHQNKLHS